MEVLKKNNKKDINLYIYIFFVTAISGWLCEIVYSLVVRNKLVNPGSLIGPWCPIYGVAAILITLFLYDRKNFFLRLISIFCISNIVEYISSYISETLFNRRIWDYSGELFNLNGRVCLSMSLLFTMSGLLALYVLIPELVKIYNNHKKVILVINKILLVLFIINILYQFIFI